ncbi:Outer membrane protein assembly factor BamB precursor [Stieleria bergensis]|uniref:Outer membrane protein assembly factor BamB n=1 Tax=Stieleria bergensis TaxID=2528025 RepID=A0A517T0H6_9BACT|nr:Outer membrane protein assembly factor BamB precursor [Planctomycetes bacterium SV_7m_r]
MEKSSAKSHVLAENAFATTRGGPFSTPKFCPGRAFCLLQPGRVSNCRHIRFATVVYNTQKAIEVSGGKLDSRNGCLNLSPSLATIPGHTPRQACFRTGKDGIPGSHLGAGDLTPQRSFSSMISLLTRLKPMKNCRQPASVLCRCLVRGAHWTWAASCVCVLSVLAQGTSQAAPPPASSTPASSTPQDAQPQTVPAQPSTGQWLWPRGNAQGTGAITNTLPAELQVAWEFTADEAIEGEPIVTAEAVFVADVFGKVYALSRQTGKLLWMKDYETGFLAAPMVHQGKLIIGDVDGQVYALQVGDGKELWKHSTAGEISGAAAVYKDSILIASQDGKLYSLDDQTGKQRWVYEAEDQIQCSPSISGDRTFLGGCDARLHIVDLKSGKSAAKSLPLSGPTGSTPAICGDYAIVPVMDGIVFAFDLKTMKQLWAYQDLEQDQDYRSSAATNGEVVIVSSQRKHIDALDLKTGKRLWRHTLRRRSDASPVIAGDDVWVPATDGRLLRLSLQDGREKWTYEVRGSFIGGVAVTGDELFIADDDGIVRCFRKK